MFSELIEEYLEMSPPELDAIIAEAELAKRAADTRIAAATAVVSARQSFRDDGHRSIPAYLKATLNCSGTTANKIRKRAELLNDHPTVGSALLEGHISIDNTDLLATAHAHPRAGHRFAEFAPTLLEHAEHFEHNNFRKIVDHFITQADPDGAFDDQKFQEDERSASVIEDNGAISVHASGGSPLQACEMKEIFDRAVEVEFQNDCDERRRLHGDDALSHPLPRTTQQRRFDALHQIFMSFVTAPTDGKTPEPLVNFLIDHVSAGKILAVRGLVETPDLFGTGEAATDLDLLNRTCQTTTGTPVHPDVVLQAMINGRIRRAVIDANGVTIDLGRTQRLFTGKAREAARLLATTCTHPGCDVPAQFCDIDHRREWASDNGATDQANSMPECGVHDRYKHTHDIRTRRATNGRIYLIRPDGSVIKPVGARDPDWAESPPDELRRPAPEPARSDSNLWSELGRVIPWDEFISTRPELAECTDSHSWTIRRIDATDMPRRAR